MFAEIAGCLPIRSVGMRSHLPNRRHCRVVDLPGLGQTQDGPRMTEPGPVDRLPVHPLGRRSVASDFQIFLELPVADGSPLGQKALDLLQYQRIALDRRGMMSLLVPDSAPDSSSFLWTRQASEALPELGDIGSQPTVDLAPRWAAPLWQSLVNVFDHGNPN